MSKRTVFTTLTPLPAGISRETVRETLHDHLEMIDLNPLVEERHPINPPNTATAEEYHCVWYQLTDKVQYLPGGMMSGKVSYNACFHDLENGLQTHVYAPMGLNIRGKWTLGGTLPGEPVAPVELGVGAPIQGLWLREDVDMKCNILMTSFVKKTLKKAHSKLVERLLMKAQIVTAVIKNQELSSGNSISQTTSDYASSYDNESMYSERSHNSPPSVASTPHLSDHPALRERPNSDSMMPRPLSVRSTSPSFGGSFMTNTTTGRNSYQDNILGINAGTNAGNRVSWNALNVRSPPVQHNQPVHQPGNYYQESSPSFQAAELHSEEPQRQDLKPMPQPTNYATYQGPSFGAVELE
jgi:hypothetical protein